MTDFSDWLLSVYQGQQSFRNLDQAFRSAWDAAAAAEREACIEIVDINGGSIEIVADIRARGQR